MEHKINKIVIAVLALTMLVFSVPSSVVATSDVYGAVGTNNPDPVNDGSVVTLAPGSTETEAIEANSETADIVIPATTADMVLEDAGGIFNIMAVSSSQVSIPDANTTSGGTVILPITIGNVTNAVAATISLSYNPSVVIVQGVSAGNLGTTTASINNVTGITSISAFSITGVSGSVILANVTLKAVGSAGSTSALNLSINSLKDISINDIPYTTVNGTFTIIAGVTPLSAGAGGPYSGVVSTVIQFSGSANGGTPPYSYLWNFGDGNTSNLQNPAHAYSSAGVYNVQLQVNDSTGATASANTTATIVGGGTVISIASQTVTPGGTVTVPIMANNITNVAAFTISLTYNPAVVVVNSVTAGTLGGVFATINNATGVTQMSAFSTTPQSGNVVLANVVLRAAGTAEQTSSLALAVTTLIDNNGNTITATVSSGTFSITSSTLVINASRANLTGAVVPTTNITTNLNTSVRFTVTDGTKPVSGAAVTVKQGGSTLGTNTTDAAGQATINVTAPTNATVTATASKAGNANGTKVLTAKGDVSGDGKVDITDALFISQSTVGLKTVDKVVGDVSGDGKADITDALFVSQYTVGLRADPTTP